MASDTSDYAVSASGRDFRKGICLLTVPLLAPVSSFPAYPLPLRPHISVQTQYWNINQLSIDYAFRPRLRSRLPQSRSALLWNPWIFGLKDSHLHLATHSGILSTINSTAPYGTASSLILCSSTNPDVAICCKIRCYSLLLQPYSQNPHFVLPVLLICLEFLLRSLVLHVQPCLQASLRKSSMHNSSQIVTSGFLSFGVVF